MITCFKNNTKYLATLLVTRIGLIPGTNPLSYQCIFTWKFSKNGGHVIVKSNTDVSGSVPHNVNRGKVLVLKTLLPWQNSWHGAFNVIFFFFFLVEQKMCFSLSEKVLIRAQENDSS